jgi:hypothetical protein
MDHSRKVKIRDIPVIFIFLLLIAFFSIPASREAYEKAYQALPVLVTFVKFALMATGGEMVARRFSTGRYVNPGFGILPKMLVWGLLGISIYWAFVVFSRGAPALLPDPGENPAMAARILTAFTVSLTMNLTFAPVMMLTHHLTDTYIASNKGRFPIGGFAVRPLLEQIDWNKMWGFIIKKTIPLFWIPAHTITFLLPEQFRTLFAAGLSVVLGIMLGAFRAKEVHP